MPGDPTEELVDLFERRGSDAYFGEAVSQLEHALQSAELARRDGRPDALVVACLLHDVGHLLSGLDEDCALHGTDDHHEGLGARWLAERFVPGVIEPVRLHVAAKRYRCAVESDYAGRLSEASIRSLALQGGPMSPAEVEAFRSQEFWRDAVTLRGYDEAAKVPGAVTPTLADFLPAIESARLR